MYKTITYKPLNLTLNLIEVKYTLSAFELTLSEEQIQDLSR